MTGLHEGRIVGTATDPDSTLLAEREAEGDIVGDPDGITWIPRPGPTYPSDGDWCLLAESDQGTWCVLAWKS